MASEVIGSGPGVTSPLTIGIGVSGGVDNFCLFFGCGSTVEETLNCLDRTGTGIVVRRGFPRPGSVLDGLPGLGSGSDMRTGLRMPTGVVDVWSRSI